MNDRDASSEQKAAALALEAYDAQQEKRRVAIKEELRRRGIHRMARTPKKFTKEKSSSLQRLLAK